MRIKIINYLKAHPRLLNFIYFFVRLSLNFFGIFIRQNRKQIIFASFGGRKFDDSPKSIYEYLINDDRFKDYEMVWAFVNPEQVKLPRGKTVKIDSPAFFISLFRSKIWISNSGIDRDIGLKKKGVIRVETWHGTPLKKICGEENSNSTLIKANIKKVDGNTIRCAQSDYDRVIFSRIFNANIDCILLSDLPRNDFLIRYHSTNEIENIKIKLGVDLSKKVILYMPTYREYLVDKKLNNYLKPPVDLNRWKSVLGDKYVVLFRAHYAVNKVLNIKNDDFVFDVSDYPNLNELYLISDIMISDYSSSFFDYSLLKRPMLCYAYDLEEYIQKRGLYLDIGKSLPCRIDRTEDDLLDSILNLDYEYSSFMTAKFKSIYAPYAGQSCEIIVNELIKKINVSE